MAKFKRFALMGIATVLYSFSVSLVICFPFWGTDLLNQIIENTQQAQYMAGIISVLVLFAISGEKTYMTLDKKLQATKRFIIAKAVICGLLAFLYHIPLRTLAYILTLIFTLVEHWNLLGLGISDALADGYPFQYTLVFLVGIDSLLGAWEKEKGKAIYNMERRA